MAYLTTTELRQRMTSDASFNQNPTTDYEAFLTVAITSAEAIINSYIGDGQRFAFETVGTLVAPVARVFTGDGSSCLYLDQPLQAFTGATNAGSAISAADVYLEPVNDQAKTLVILKRGGWSWERQGVIVHGVWGWGPPPSEIVEATAEVAVRIVKGRAAGYSDTIGVNPDGTQQYVKALPPMVKLALDLAKVRYRQPQAGANGWGFGVA